jgi:hypothetical protein
VANERADHFLREWAAAVRKYEEADREVKRIMASYLAQADAGLPLDKLAGRRHHHELSFVEADRLARQDPRRKDAGSARSLYAERATMYGISVLVEILRDRNNRRDSP